MLDPKQGSQTQTGVPNRGFEASGQFGKRGAKQGFKQGQRPSMSSESVECWDLTENLLLIPNLDGLKNFYLFQVRNPRLEYFYLSEVRHPGPSESGRAEMFLRIGVRNLSPYKSGRTEISLLV
jgi:hypothetical protein